MLAHPEITHPIAAVASGPVGTSVEVLEEALDRAHHDRDVPVRFNEETGRYELSQVDVDFPLEEGMSRQDLQQQLGQQQDGLNQLSSEEWLHNTEFYENHRGKGGYVETETGKVRKNYNNWRKRNGLDTDGDALHGPDAVAGGRLETFDGVGDSRLNQHIGREWVRDDRVADMRADIREQVTDIPADLRPYVNINVRLGIED